MHLADISLEISRYVSLLQTRRVSLAFVTQNIMFRSENNGWWKPLEILGVQRRGVGLGTARGLWKVLIPVPDHSIAGLQQFIFRIQVGGTVEICVGHGVDEHL